MNSSIANKGVIHVRPSIARSVIPVIAAILFAGGCSKPAPDSLQRGKDFLAKGELASAVIEFRNAVQADANSLDARLALGETLERTGDQNGAEQNYRRALDLGGNADDLVPRIAILMLDRGDVQTIVREFGDRQLALPSADSDLRGIVALAQLALGRKESATAQLAKAESNAPAVMLARAQTSVLAGRTEEALAELDSVLQSGKAPWWVLRAASRAHGARGDGAKALEAMKAAYDLAAGYPSVIGEYAEQLFHAGKLEEAQGLLNRLKQMAPSYYRTAYLESLFLARAGKLDDAHGTASKVLGKLPDHAPSLLLAAQIELEKGEFASAETHVERLLSKNPSSLSALRLKLALDLKRGDTASAAKTLERALLLSPNDRSLLAASADLAWARGDRAAALRQLTAAAETQPPVGELLVRLAEMRFATGKKAEAAKTIAQVMELAKDDARLRERAFRAATGMGMLDTAREIAKAEVERRPKEPEPLLWQAALSGMARDENAALELTGKALDIQPDYHPALMALARTATTPERRKEYEARMRKAIDSGTRNPRIYLDHAMKLNAEGADVETVAAILAKGMAADPASLPVRRAAINHWLAAGQTDKAVAIAKEGEAALEDNAATGGLMAATLEAAGKFDQAAAKYAELESRFPDRVHWGLERARVLLAAGKAQDAILALRKVVSDHPEEPLAYRVLALAQVDQKQVEDALLTADMLASKPKQRIAGLFLKGDVQARARDKAAAIKAYDEAAQAGAEEEALLRRVELHDRTGGEATASQELNDWLKKHPRSIPAMSMASRRALGQQDYVAAAGHLDSIVKIEPRNAIALNDLAWVYVLAKNPAALATAQKAMELMPDNPQVLDTFASAQALAGKKVEAIANLRLSLALAPGNPVVKIHLAELLAEQGNKKEAATLIEGLEKMSVDRDSAARLRELKARL